MSHRRGSSGWRSAGPFTTPIIGTSMFSMFMVKRRASEPSLPHCSTVSLGTARSVEGVTSGPENSLPVPVRMMSWFSGSRPMSRNACSSSVCAVGPQRSESLFVWIVISRMPSSRLNLIVSNFLA